MRWNLWLIMFLTGLGPALAEDAEDKLVIAQQQAVWEVIKAEPKLADVDQITFESTGTAALVSGWIEKWGEKDGKSVRLNRPFFTRVDRVCGEVEPKCFRSREIWSRGERLTNRGQ